MKRIAILLLGHRNPEQINAFIGQILASPGEHGVFVHIDRNAQGVAERIVEHPRVHVLEERIAVRWADISQVEAMLALLRAAVQKGAASFAFDVFTFRSGQDLAVRANWAEYFEAGGGKKGYGMRAPAPAARIRDTG